MLRCWLQYTQLVKPHLRYPGLYAVLYGDHVTPRLSASWQPQDGLLGSLVPGLVGSKWDDRIRVSGLVLLHLVPETI